jgi:hypothetical protein
MKSTAKNFVKDEIGFIKLVLAALETQQPALGDADVDSE